MDKYDVFISYSRKDSDVAKRITGALEKVGIKYFIDVKGISGGVIEIGKTVQYDNATPINISSLVKGLLIQQCIIDGLLKDYILLDTIGLPLTIESGSNSLTFEEDTVLPCRQDDSNWNGVRSVTLKSGNCIIDESIPAYPQNGCIVVRIHNDRRIIID